MSNNVKGVGAQHSLSARIERNKESSDGSFGKTMRNVADGALSAVSTAGTMVPGGGLISAAAQGLRSVLGAADKGGNGDQMDQMWAMQRESQMFNLQYLELQTAIQEDNRRFSTMSNLMKARHDTAKAAINNMHV